MPRLEQGYPWCLNVAFVAAGIIFLGIALRKPLLIFAVQKGSVLLATFVASLVGLFLGTVARQISHITRLHNQTHRPTYYMDRTTIQDVLLGKESGESL